MSQNEDREIETPESEPREPMDTTTPMSGKTPHPSNEVRSLSPEEWKRYVENLLTNYTSEVDNLLTAKLAIKDRSKGFELVEQATENIRREIDGLGIYALISPELYKCLLETGLTGAEKVDRLLEFANHMQRILTDLTTLTQTPNFLKASEEIHGIYSKLLDFCAKREVPFDQWETQMGQIVEENDNLKTEIKELKSKLQNDKDQSSPTESMKLLYGLSTGTPSEYRRAQAAQLMNSSDNEFQASREFMGRPSSAPSRLLMPPISLSNHPHLQSENLSYRGQRENNGLNNYSGLAPTPTELYFKSQALPPLQPFTGQGDRTLREFLISFDSKYPCSIFSEDDRRNLFIPLLDKKAKRCYKSLDPDLQKGDLASIIVALAPLLRKDEQVESLKSMQRIEQLKLENNQLVKYCDALERLTRQAHPSMPAAEISFIRATHLYRQIMTWPRSIDALRILEKYDRSTVYKELKDLVFEWERNRQHCLSLSPNNPTPSNRRQGYNTGQSPRPQQQVENRPQNPPTQQNNSQPTCYTCGQPGHFRQQCPQTPRTDPRPQQQNQGYGRSGYNNDQQPKNQGRNNFQRQNQNPPNNHNFNNNQQQGDRPPRVNVMEVNKAEQPPLELLKYACGITTPYEVNTLGTEELPYFGQKPLYDVEVGTYRCRSLVDSGAQPSVMSVEVYRDMVLSLASPKDHIEVLNPLTTLDSNIVDASGCYMEVKAQIAVNVKLLHTGRQGRVVFHLVKSARSDPPNEIIIGTNAFKTLGIEIMFKPPEGHQTTQQVKEVTEPSTRRPTTQDASTRSTQPIKIVKRMVIEPNEARWITVQLEHNTPALQNKNLYVTPADDPQGKPIMADAVCNFDREGKSKMLINNSTPQVMILRKGQVIGDVEESNEIYSISTLRLQEIFSAPSTGIDETSHTCSCPQVNTISHDKKEERVRELIQTAEEGREQPLPHPIVEILTKYEDNFALSDGDLKQTDLVEHTIETGEAEPIRQKLRPIPAGVRKEFREIIDGLLEKKIIEPSKSPWASPIVLVKKKDGGIRLCIDYREVNKVIKLDSYPLPPVNSILQALAGRKYFSTLDLCAGFWQVRLADNAKEKTAFISSLGLYQFRVLPFGLATSPATFQRLLDNVLSKFDMEHREVFCYIDDILIATTTEERHHAVLDEVMTALQSANLAVKLKKCKFLERSVKYLGHVVDGEGVHTDPEKVKAIKEAKPPKNLKDLRSFLGLVGYYRRFVLKFASIAHPLFQLTKNNEAYKWTEECSQAFENLKERLCQTPILIQPDIDGAITGENGFQIYCDASGRGIGAVLCQLGKDKLLHPIWFVSRSLTKAEAGYHISDLEALAIVFALQKFNSLIFNMKNTVVKTDHLPLLCLFKKNISARMLRWSLLIQHFNVRIDYVKGQGNVVADALSRGLAPTNPHVEASDKEMSDDLAAKVVSKITTNDNQRSKTSEKDEEDWLQELSADPAYEALIQWLRIPGQGDKKVEPLTIYDGHQKLRHTDFILEQDNLWLITEGCSPRRVVPQSKRHQLFSTAHQGVFSGHFSPKKIHKRLKTNFYWECMARDITKWHKECTKCYLTNLQETLTPPLKPILTSRPYEIVGIDTMELGPTTNGNRYVLVLIDHFTKFMGAYPIADKTAETIARTIVTRWIGEGRWPTSFLSDQGSEFLNETMEMLRKITQIKWTVTKGYCPRENGITERANKTLQRSIKKLINNPAEWDNLLPFVVYTYNTTAHESTNESPFFLLHGFDAPSPSTSTIMPRPTYQLVDYSDYKESLVEAIKEAHNITIARNLKEQERHVAYYNKKHRTDDKVYPKVGDRVFMRLPSTKPQSKHPKLTINIQGPYRVLETSQNSALITLINHNEEPVRVQHDLLILLPAGLAAPEFATKLKRKTRPKQLNFIGLLGKITVIGHNSIFNSRVPIIIELGDPVHPDHLCKGDDTPQGKIVCPMTTTTLEDIGTFFGYPIGGEIKRKKATTVAEVANYIAILEDSSIHRDTRISMIMTNRKVDVEESVWARSYQFAKTRCPHLCDFLDKTTRCMEQYRFEPSIYTGIADSPMLRRALLTCDQVKPKVYQGGRDLLLVPHHYLLDKMEQLSFQHCTMRRYNRDLNLVYSEMMKSQFRNVMMMLPPGIPAEDVDKHISKLQQIASVNKNLVTIIPNLVYKDIESWREDMEKIVMAWTKLHQDCNASKDIIRVHVHGPKQDEPIQMGFSWSLLGEKLEKRRPVTPLDINELTVYWDTVYKELKQNGIISGLIVQQKRKMKEAEGPLPKQHKQNNDSYEPRTVPAPHRHLEPPRSSFPRRQQIQRLHPAEQRILSRHNATVHRRRDNNQGRATPRVETLYVPGCHLNPESIHVKALTAIKFNGLLRIEKGTISVRNNEILREFIPPTGFTAFEVCSNPMLNADDYKNLPGYKPCDGQERSMVVYFLVPSLLMAVILSIIVIYRGKLRRIFSGESPKCQLVGVTRKRRLSDISNLMSPMITVEIEPSQSCPQPSDSVRTSSTTFSTGLFSLFPTIPDDRIRGDGTKKIGEGSFGWVSLMEFRNDDGDWQKCVIKYSKRTRQLNAMIGEIETLWKHRGSPYIVKSHALFHNIKHGIGAILEFCDNGSLDQTIFNVKVTYPRASYIHWLQQISAGLYYLHLNGLAHRDLKSAKYDFFIRDARVLNRFPLQHF